MSDHFGAIGAGESESRLPLVYQKPYEKNGVFFPLNPCGGKPSAVYEKLGDKARLDALISKLGEKYAPFLCRTSPECENPRRKTELSRFMFRRATDEDRNDFISVLGGAGSWEEVTVPHYGGPVGYSVSYYRTEFTPGKIADDKSLFIHFQCSDYITEVYVNGTLVGCHEGFFGSFEFDVTDELKDGSNSLLVVVKNDFKYGGEGSEEDENIRCEGDKLYAATGMGYDDPVRGWHHCPAGTGLSGKVYTEIRPRTFISDIFVRPMPDENEIEIWSYVFRCDYAPESDVSLSYTVLGENFDGKLIEKYDYSPFTLHHEYRGDIITESDVNSSSPDKPKIRLKFGHGENLIKLRLKVGDFKAWTPDTPYLYRAYVTLYVGGKKLDSYSEAFGMRSFRIDTSGSPKGMFYLGKDSIRLRGANTMGFEQQDVLSGNKDLLIYDMLMAKAANMNFLRITQRPVQEEIYQICDRIGLMIQTDLPLFTVIRRTKFAEGLRQCEEMEKLIRNHPCCVLISYMNEPMANADDRPHRHFVRAEQDAFFSALDSAVTMQNPDRAIKHIDGDYDPPDTCLPDNHCYTCWYNGHGIDMGELYRGYWLGIKDDWYCACGEFGAEGLDPVALMRRHYPKDWLPQTEEEEKSWSPSRIKDSQSGNMHYFFYDTQDTLDGWVKESQNWQARATKLQTEAFRRNSKMVSFAIHLFIDAWPSGWMKTIVDCERTPKPAFFAYRDALSPILASLRTDRKTYFSGEKVKVEAYVCNDTQTASHGHTVRFELIDGKGELKAVSADFPAQFGKNGSFLLGEAVFDAPKTNSRAKYTLRMILSDGDGKVVHYGDEPLEFFAERNFSAGDAIKVGGDEYFLRESELQAAVRSGKTVIISGLLPGEYSIGGTSIKVKSCGMRPLHFVSAKTGHPLVSDFEKNDFSFWYDDEKDMMTPLLRRTFTGEGLIPILISGNNKSGSAWGQPLFPAFAVAELPFGNGRFIISELETANHMKNPVCAAFTALLSLKRK